VAVRAWAVHRLGLAVARSTPRVGSNVQRDREKRKSVCLRTQHVGAVVHLVGGSMQRVGGLAHDVG
jgi:hypothetical protein